jgi:hypothetical protein
VSAKNDAPSKSVGRATWHRTYKARDVVAGLGAGLAIVAVTAPFSPIAAGVIGFVLYFSFLFATIAIASGILRPVPSTGEVSVRDGAVLLDGKEILPAGAVNNGAVADGASAGRYLARLGKQSDMFPRCVLEFDDKTRANEVLSTLALDPAHHTFGVSTLSGLGYGKGAIVASFAPILIGLGLVPLLVPVSHPLAAVVASLGYLMWLTSFLFTRTRTVIGTDGVLVKWLWMRRFCPWSEVKDVEYTPGGVRLVKNDGSPFDITVLRGRNRNVDAPAVIAMKQTREELYERCVQMLQGHRSREFALDPATLAREDRDTRAWITAVRGVLAGMKGMRSADVPRDAFWNLLLDGGADEEARAGAIAAIAADATHEERTRLRAAADTVASPRLRVVLEAASHGDEEELTDAMDDVRVARVKR